MASHLQLRKLYLLRRHACKRKICYTSCICHACSRIICYASWISPIGKHTVAYSTTHAPHACVALTATHACMRSHNPAHKLARRCMRSRMFRHMLYLPHKHSCGRKIRHKGMHARHIVPHRKASSRMQPYILLHMLYLPGRHEYICVICHTDMYIVTRFAHRLYLPHTHEYICIICHIGMHAVAYSATEDVSVTHARMEGHNLPHTHAHIASSATRAHM